MPLQWTQSEDQWLASGSWGDYAITEQAGAFAVAMKFPGATRWRYIATKETIVAAQATAAERDTYVIGS